MDIPSAVHVRERDAGTPELDAAARFGALLIPVAGDWHALALSCVREVVADPLVTALPTAPGTVIGVFNLRGEIVPLFDTAALLGLGVLPSYAFVVVVESAVGLAGLAATGVPEAVTLGEPTGTTETLGTTASYTIGTRVATLLDLDVLLESQRVRTNDVLEVAHETSRPA